MARKVYHVTWNSDKERWENTAEGASRASSTHATKDEAVSRAREMAKKQPLGQVIVHKKDGKIQTEYTYGDDPVRSKG